MLESKIFMASQESGLKKRFLEESAMGVSILRFRGKNGRTAWAAVDGEQAYPLVDDAESLSAFLKNGGKEKARVALEGKLAGVPTKDLDLLSSVTAPCQIICQGKNYLDHIIETGVKPKNKDFNLLFTKADSTLAPAIGKVHRPQYVRLLDYEIELGLVIGRNLNEAQEITDSNLHEFVAGWVMANDVSARDVQVPERQWFKGKSFRGFCPVGPVLFLADKDDFAFLYDLNLELKVNGKVRQKASTKQLMHKPADTLSEISKIFDLRMGDLLLTGTPGGVSMRVRQKSTWEELRDVFKSDKEKFQAFIEEQAASGRYLQAGDVIESSIRSSDGKINLGNQRLQVIT